MMYQLMVPEDDVTGTDGTKAEQGAGETFGFRQAFVAKVRGPDGYSGGFTAILTDR